MTDLPPPPAQLPKVRRYVPAVGPRLKKLLYVVLGMFSLMSINAIYLVAVTIGEWYTGETFQNFFYQYMFLAHLGVGLLMVGPVVIFGVLHIKNAYNRPNRRAVRVGYALFVTALVLIASGFVLMRIEGLIDVKSPKVRSAAYWIHVLSPIALVWLFVLHRLAGPKIQWKSGLALGAGGAVFALIMVAMHSQDPRQWNVEGPADGERYFFPSLARTATGNFIPAETLMMDSYCLECHPDIHETWSHSMHRLSSFNNPAYLFSVRQTREAMLARDGNVQGSRFCAGCHDPVPFFSGAFDDPKFDDVAHPTAHAGITCTVCHAITHVATPPRGNADYTIEEPPHYPFASSESGFLRWVNRQLIKAKPEFHKKTFLKPLHKTPEFCASCHKVHLPKELNDYKWLRGQNHYDAYHLSGVSGHGIESFYYPPKAEDNCNDCHMPRLASEDFGARYYDDGNELQVHDHQFPSANTAIPHLLDLPPQVNEKHRKFNEGVMRVDIFGLREGGTIVGKLLAPIRPEIPELEAGKEYLLETVIRTLKMGHLFTQGTADSNEVWLDVTVTSGDSTLGRSGGQSDRGDVDPWSHFVNSYVLDRDGNRIDRRNAEDIFVALYSHQIPPGAADTVHYLLKVPPEQNAPLTVTVKLQYRKFDATYMRHIKGESYINTLPVMTLAEDRVTFGVVNGATTEDAPQSLAPPEPAWERWYDYGIGLFRKGSKGSQKGELRQAEGAFREVERLGRPEGPLTRARVYIKEGRLEEAVEALRVAASHNPPAYPWSVAWFTGIVNKQNGNLDKAIENFRTVAETKFQEARDRNFDFGQNYVVLNQLAQTLFERAKRERGDGRKETRQRLLEESRDLFLKALSFDSENVTAHYNLALIEARLGNKDAAQRHRELHSTYKPDDNARDRAVAIHRAKNPAADHAAETIVLYDLHRRGAFELSGEGSGDSSQKSPPPRRDEN